MLRRDEIVDAGSQSCMLVVTVFALERNQADEIIVVLKAFVVPPINRVCLRPLQFFQLFQNRLNA